MKRDERKVALPCAVYTRVSTDSLRDRLPADRPSDSSADMMPPSEYLGRTIDLFGDQGAAPERKRRSPELIRRRAAPRGGITGNRSSLCGDHRANCGTVLPDAKGA